MVPFTRDQFFAVFASYNEAVWPVQIVLAACGVAAVCMHWRGHGRAARVLMGTLAAFWLWMGLVYHVAFFASINPSAYAFGVLFLLQGGLFAWASREKGIARGAARDLSGAIGGMLVSYALLVYPAIGLLTRNEYFAGPTFGTPCPTTIFTFGALLLSRARIPGYLLVIPVGWSILGSSAIWTFGVVEDAGLPLAAAVGGSLILLRNRRLTRRPTASAYAPGRMVQSRSPSGSPR